MWTNRSFTIRYIYYIEKTLKKQATLRIKSVDKFSFLGDRNVVK